MSAWNSRYLIVTPVLDDWESLQLLLAQLDTALAKHGYRADVFAVDDGSAETARERLRSAPYRAIGQVAALQLRRNVGHQRAIAVALAYVEQTADLDAVIVMDSDGEDRPDHIPLLLDMHRRSGPRRVIFGERAKRSESLTFRAGYTLYRGLFRLLTGRRLRMGNFSLIPFELLHRVAASSEIWNHYASGMIKTRIPYATLPLDRGTRLAGASKMNLVSLIMHGLSAVSVFADVVGVRLLLASTLIAGGSVAFALGVLAVKFGTDLAIPGWTTSALGFCSVAILQSLTMAFLLAMFTLSGRNNGGFLPLRDYAYFILGVDVLQGGASAVSTTPPLRKAN